MSDSVASFTVQVRMIGPGDQWFDETVVSVANSYRPENVDITLLNQGTNTTRVMTTARNRWIRIFRSVPASLPAPAPPS